MAPAGPPVSERELLTQRLCWAVAITLLVTHATLAWLGRIPAVTPAANDDALYLLLARSLSAFHYVDQHLVGAPGHAQYPPAYPASLALAGMVFGDSLNVAQAVTILFSTLGLLLLFDIARRFAGPVIAVLVLVVLAFNRPLLIFAGRIASEPPYLAFSIATLWVLTCLPESRKQYALAGGLAILTALTRTIGVSMVAALIVHWLLQRRFRPALVFSVIALVTVGGWLYWTTIAPNQFTERSYTAVATSTAQHFSGPFDLVLTRTLNFGKVYLAKSIGAGLGVPTVEGPTIDNALWLGFFLLFGIVGFWHMRKRSPAIPLYFMAYCGVLLLYPYKMTRFLMPVEPLIVLSTLVGVVVALRRWGPRLPVVLAAVIAIAITVNNAPQAWRTARKLRDCNRAQATVSSSCFEADRLAFFEAARFAKDHLPPRAAVLTIKEATFYYHTGHSVLHPDLAIQRGKNDVIGFVRRQGVEYVLVNAFVGGAEIVRHLLPACDRVELIRDFGERTMLLRLHDGPPAGATDACASFRAIEKAILDEELESSDDASM
jgi:hypothetical protein